MLVKLKQNTHYNDNSDKVMGSVHCQYTVKITMHFTVFTVKVFYCVGSLLFNFTVKIVF